MAEITGSNRRSCVETTMGRYKGIIGATLRTQSPAGQDTESAIAVAVLNRMLRWSAQLHPLSLMTS